MTTRLLIMALNGPVEGKELEYNEWYDTKHLPDLFRTPGMVRARRFKIANARLPAGVSWPYVGLYEVETDDVPTFLKEMAKYGGELSDTLDKPGSAFIVASEITRLEK